VCAFNRTGTATPEWYVKNVEGYIHTVTGEPPDTVFAWNFQFEGDVARWHECPAVDSCSWIERERPNKDVLAIDVVGTAPVADGGVVEVVKLTLDPGRKYVVVPGRR
jgi:hypothetical protein